jgi:hypothetical protein
MDTLCCYCKCNSCAVILPCAQLLYVALAKQAFCVMLECPVAYAASLDSEIPRFLDSQKLARSTRGKIDFRLASFADLIPLARLVYGMLSLELSQSLALSRAVSAPSQLYTSTVGLESHPFLCPLARAMPPPCPPACQTKRKQKEHIC